jgi:signal transduction histidine kinase
MARWGPAVAVAVLAQTRLGLSSPWTGSDLSLTFTSLAVAAPLAIRTTHPLLAAAGLALALVAQDAVGDSLGFASFVAVLVASYSAGRHARPRRAVLGAAVVLVGVLVAMRESAVAQPDELVFPLFYISAAAAIGGVIRRLAQQSTDLRRLNAALAAERDATARLAVANERMRLARDLHDVVAHTLTVVVVQAENAEEAIDGQEPERARAAVRTVQEAGRRGLADLRSMVRVLRETERPGAEPGLAEVEALAALMAGAGLVVTVRREGDLAGVPDGIGRDLARLVQEALTNVVKHSAAEEALVHLTVRDGWVEATVEDPGPALASDIPSGGLGVDGMAERLAPYGGSVSAAPCSDGFRVHARVPLVREVVP